MITNINSSTPLARLSRREGALARRQQLLEAACALIFERGFEAVSLADIGAQAGVSGPAIYRHFSSKADLLAVLCGQTIDRLIEFVGPRRADPREELRALVEGQVRLVVLYPLMVRVFEDEQRSLPEPLRRDIRRREREHAQRWVDALRLIHPTARSEELEILAYSAVGMILSAPRWPRLLRSDLHLGAKLGEAAWRILGADEPVPQPPRVDP